MNGQEIMDKYYKLNPKEVSLVDFIDERLHEIKLEEYSRGFNAGVEFERKLAPLMQERRDADQAHN